MSAFEPGRRIGPYEVEALVGMGGMGAVYRARDVRLGRRVALKVVRTDREDHTGVAPEERLIAEARAAAALRHPHVVEIYDAGTDEGQTYVAMEYIDGKPLRAYVGDESVPLATRKRWVTEIGAALAAAHRAGLIHRDIKPDNVIVDGEGEARVLDFGLAKRLAFDQTAPTADAPAAQTLDGRIVGTVSYMAPEQLAGAPPDPKWDQFAWGVLAYELMTGLHPRQTVPMPGQTAHLTQTPKMPNEIDPAISFSDAAAIMLAIAPEPARRFPSMDAALAALRDEPAPPPERPVVVQAPPRSAPAPALSRPSAWPLIAAGIVAAAAGVIAGGAVHLGSAAPRVVTASATPSASPSSAPSPPPPAFTPLASIAPPPRASSSAAPRARTGAARPEDYGTQCSCMLDGHLCPLGSDLHKRRCYCGDPAGGELTTTPNGYADFFGRDLKNGQPCSGYDANGARASGKYTQCRADCNEASFAGIHRTACRGLNEEDGREQQGLLFCY